MMKNPIAHWKTLAIGAAMLGITGTALAYGGSHEHGFGGCDRGQMQAVYHLKDLTADQRTKLDALHKSERTTMRETGDALRDTRRDLRDAMEDGADLDKIGKLADKQAAAFKAMILQVAEARQKVDAILTDKQRAELKEMRGNRGDYPGRW